MSSSILHEQELSKGAQFNGLRRWEAVKAALLANFENPDTEAAQILFASVAAHRITRHPPVWAMLIAPSGSMKTALLDTLQNLQSVHFVDEVTQNTFISGKLDERGTKRQTPASLLHRIGKQGILVVADFSTVLGMDNRKKPAVLAQFRRIYDGNFSREFGTGENLDEHRWEGRITVLAGVTPEFDRHHSVFQSLGERFIRIRWPRAGGVEAGLRAMRQQTSAATGIRSAVHDFLLPVLSQATIPAPRIGDANEVRLANLGELIARARAYVPRTREYHEIIDEPETEGNTRLPQQLAQIGRGWAALEGSETVTEAGMELICRVAFDCMPPLRHAVLKALVRRENPYALELPSSPVNRAVEELQAVGLVTKDSRKAELSDLAAQLLERAKITFPQSGVDTDGIGVVL
jgi:hypothetical protein